MKLGKKAQAMDQLATIVVSLIGVAIVIGVGMIILVQLLNQTDDIDPMGCCANKTQYYNKTLVKCCKLTAGVPDCTVVNREFTAACNSTIDTINAADDIPGWLSVIVIVIIGAILIALVSVFRRQ